MDDAGAGLFGQGFGQPFNEAFHFRHRLGFREPILLRPAFDLPPEVIPGLAKIGQASGFDINIVQRRQSVDHRLVRRTALGWV